MGGVPVLFFEGFDVGLGFDFVVYFFEGAEEARFFDDDFVLDVFLDGEKQHGGRSFLFLYFENSSAGVLDFSGFLSLL